MPDLYALPERIIIRNWLSPDAILQARFRLRNGGTSPVGPITVSKPRTPRFEISGPQTLASVEPGEAIVFAVKFLRPNTSRESNCQDTCVVSIGSDPCFFVRLQATREEYTGTEVFSPPDREIIPRKLLDNTTAASALCCSNETGPEHNAAAGESSPSSKQSDRPRSGRASRGVSEAMKVRTEHGEDRVLTVQLHPDRRDLFFIEGKWLTARGEEWQPPPADASVGVKPHRDEQGQRVVTAAQVATGPTRERLLRQSRSLSPRHGAESYHSIPQSVKKPPEGYEEKKPAAVPAVVTTTAVQNSASPTAANVLCSTATAQPLSWECEARRQGAPPPWILQMLDADAAGQQQSTGRQIGAGLPSGQRDQQSPSYTNGDELTSPINFANPANYTKDKPIDNRGSGGAADIDGDDDDDDDGDFVAQLESDLGFAEDNGLAMRRRGQQKQQQKQQTWNVLASSRGGGADDEYMAEEVMASGSGDNCGMPRQTKGPRSRDAKPAPGQGRYCARRPNPEEMSKQDRSWESVH